MRLLALLLLLPATAWSQTLLTLEEFAAEHPGHRCYTDHADLHQIGIPEVGLDWALLEERGGNFSVQDVGDVSFIGGPWTYQTLGGDAVQGTLVSFLETHPNEYDFVTIFVTQSLNFGALYGTLQNDTRGIGRQLIPPQVPSHPELDGYLFMNSIFDYLYNSTESVRDAAFFGQEVGHRWGAFVRRRGGFNDTLGRDDSHWSFFMDTDNSAMEGNQWVETSPGRWQTDHEYPIAYSELDMYLMGFIPPEQVSPWTLIDDPVVVDNPVGWGGDNGIGVATSPYYNVQTYVPEAQWPLIRPITVTGTEIQVPIEDIIFREGDRIPDSTASQREFRMGFVIMHPESEPVDFDDYLVVEDTREGLKALWEDMVQQEGVLDLGIHTSGSYRFHPGVFTPDVVFEPELLPEDEDGEPIYGEEPVTGSGCAVGGGGGFAGLLLLGARRRRG